MKSHHLLALVLSLQWSVATELPRAHPEEQGVSSSAILEFLQAADKSIDSLHSFMLLRHGHVISEAWWSPYKPDAPHALFSLSKSFTSTAVGIAIDEGKLSVDDEVLKFFPGDASAEPDKNLKAMRVRDLLRMNTGHETEPPRPPEGSWKKAFLNHPVRFKPGTHFLYNTSATYMLAAIVEKVAGMSLVDYLRPRLFAPIGIENPAWDKSPEGIALGGYGLSITTEDIARFGQLCLQKGKWQGKQLVSEAWLAEATSFQTANGSNPRSDWDQGYGYQFWRCRNGAFRGDGAFGQYCVVLPQQDAVIAITGGLKDMQSVLNLVWEKLLPALDTKAPLSRGKSGEKLAQIQKNLMIPPQDGTVNRPEIAGRVSGLTYQFSSNPRKLETVMLESRGDKAFLVIRQNGVESRIECGQKVWRDSQALWGSERLQPIAGSGGWTSEDIFTAKVCPYQTPFVYTLALKFSDGEVRCSREANVGFGPTKEPELTATAVQPKP